MEDDGRVFGLQVVDEEIGGFVDCVGEEEQDDEEGEEGEKEHFQGTDERGAGTVEGSVLGELSLFVINFDVFFGCWGV